MFGFVEVQKVHIFVLIIGREETFGIRVDRIFNIIHIHNIIFYKIRRKEEWKYFVGDRICSPYITQSID